MSAIRSGAALVCPLVLGVALTAPSSALATTYTERTLPFVGLSTPSGVAVDPAGDVFAVGHTSPTATHGVVMELPAGSSIPAILPFTASGLENGVAVDPAGDVFASDVAKVVELPVGSTVEQNLTLTPISSLGGNNVAADSAGDVFVTSSTDTVLELSAGGTTQQTDRGNRHD